MEFYEQLSDYMKELNISVHEMALACDVSDSVISRYKTVISFHPSQKL